MQIAQILSLWMADWADASARQDAWDALLLPNPLPNSSHTSKQILCCARALLWCAVTHCVFLWLGEHRVWPCQFLTAQILEDTMLHKTCWGLWRQWRDLKLLVTHRTGLWPCRNNPWAVKGSQSDSKSQFKHRWSIFRDVSKIEESESELLMQVPIHLCSLCRSQSRRRRRRRRSRGMGTAVGWGRGARWGRAGAAVHGDFETWAASSLDVHGRDARGAATTRAARLPGSRPKKDSCEQKNQTRDALF